MLHNVIARYVTVIWSMIQSLQPTANHFLWAFLTLDMIFLGINIASGKMASIEAIIEKIAIMGAIILIVTHFPLIATGFRNGIVSILGAGTNTSSALKGRGYQDVLSGVTYRDGRGDNNLMTPSSIMDDPSEIMRWAQENLIAKMAAAQKKVDQANNPEWWDLGKKLERVGQNVNVYIIYTLVTFGIELAFIVIAVELAIAQIEFYLILFFALLLVPFIAWQPLRFIGMRSFTAVINQALKLGIIVGVISLGMKVLNSTTADLFAFTNLGAAMNNSEYADISVLAGVLAACGLLTFLCIQVPALAMALVSGNPALSSSSFAQNMIGLGAIGLAALRPFRSYGSHGSSQQQEPSRPVSASSTSSVSSTPTSAGTPVSPQSFFTPPTPAALPSRAASAAHIPAVNPVGSGAAVVNSERQPHGQLFQSGSGGGSAVNLNNSSK